MCGECGEPIGNLVILASTRIPPKHGGSQPPHFPNPIPWDASCHSTGCYKEAIDTCMQWGCYGMGGYPLLCLPSWRGHFFYWAQLVAIPIHHHIPTTTQLQSTHQHVRVIDHNAMQSNMTNATWHSRIIKFKAIELVLWEDFAQNGATKNISFQICWKHPF